MLQLELDNPTPVYRTQNSPRPPKKTASWLSEPLNQMVMDQLRPNALSVTHMIFMQMICWEWLCPWLPVLRLAYECKSHLHRSFILGFVPWWHPFTFMERARKKTFEEEIFFGQGLVPFFPQHWALHSRKGCFYYPGQNNHYSQDIHEIDLQCDHAISCAIDFDLQRELATRRYRGSRRSRTEARYRTISHNRTVDQPHEFLGCNDFFFGQGSRLPNGFRTGAVVFRVVCGQIPSTAFCQISDVLKNQRRALFLVGLQALSTAFRVLLRPQLRVKWDERLLSDCKWLLESWIVSSSFSQSCGWSRCTGLTVSTFALCLLQVNVRHSMHPPSPGTPELDAGGSDHEEECPWSEHISSSKKPYFFNRKTNVSQWHMPPELALFRQRKEQRRIAAVAAAAASTDRSSTAHGNVQDVSPPNTPISNSGNPALTIRAASSHGPTNALHGGQATPQPIAGLQVGGHRPSSSSPSLQLAPTTPLSKPILVSQYGVQDGHIVPGSSVVPTMNNVDLAQPALHPLQQATLLQKQFTEASRQGSITPGTPSPSVPGPLQMMHQPQTPAIVQQKQAQQPSVPGSVQGPSKWAGSRLESRSVLASAPSILYSHPSVRYQQHPPAGAAFAEHFSRSAIAHLQGWPCEALERQSQNCKKDYESTLYSQHPRLAQQLHHTQSVSRALSLSSKVSEAKLRALSRQRQELEEQLGINSNS